jgi:hypothetical protein
MPSYALTEMMFQGGVPYYPVILRYTLCLAEVKVALNVMVDDELCSMQPPVGMDVPVDVMLEDTEVL